MEPEHNSDDESLDPEHANVRNLENLNPEHNSDEEDSDIEEHPVQRPRDRHPDFERARAIGFNPRVVRHNFGPMETLCPFCNAKHVGVGQSTA